MIARSAAAIITTHFTQAAGHQTIATTMIAAANKKRQKHNFMMSISFQRNYPYPIKKNIQFQYNFPKGKIETQCQNSDRSEPK
jgi:hypothetical protein